MTKQERTYSKEFVAYQKFIVSHQAYKGMPSPKINSEAIAWVAATTGSLGKARKEWWDKTKLVLQKKSVLSDDAKISDVARLIHPTKYKPCQTCGKILSVEYVYLNSNGLRKFSKIFPSILIDEYTEIGIIINKVSEIHGEAGLLNFVNEFQLAPVDNKIQNIEKAFKTEKISLLSPGAMSNAPDRFDGFHSYNKCCRSVEDKGRSKENLSKYGEDRRAYENWADGDWKAASWLMREFAKHKVSADHIGPISLGFCHTPFFSPMTKQENSAKNNRLRYSDVKKLLNLESKGNQIISWHTKIIWDKYKNQITNDDDALELSKKLRKHLHRVLLVLNEIKESGNEIFLKSLLNPEYAFYSIKVIDFNPHTGEYLRIEKTRGNITQYSRNAERYIKIAFDSLEQYKLKDNRKLADIDEKIIKSIVEKIELTIERHGFDKAKLVLQKSLGDLDF